MDFFNGFLSGTRLLSNAHTTRNQKKIKRKKNIENTKLVVFLLKLKKINKNNKTHVGFANLLPTPYHWDATLTFYLVHFGCVSRSWLNRNLISLKGLTSCKWCFLFICFILLVRIYLFSWCCFALCWYYAKTFGPNRAKFNAIFFFKKIRH